MSEQTPLKPEDYVVKVSRVFSPEHMEFAPPGATEEILRGELVRQFGRHCAGKAAITRREDQRGARTEVIYTARLAIMMEEHLAQLMREARAESRRKFHREIQALLDEPKHLWEDDAYVFARHLKEEFEEKKDV